MFHIIVVIDMPMIEVENYSKIILIKQEKNEK